MGQCFDLDEVTPIIRRVIGEVCTQKQDFATHEEIARALMKDPAGRRTLDASIRTCPDKSRDWLANNMIAWFSQSITVGTSPYRSLFERVKIRGRWAYRPTATIRS